MRAILNSDCGKAGSVGVHAQDPPCVHPSQSRQNEEPQTGLPVRVHAPGVRHAAGSVRPRLPKCRPVLARTGRLPSPGRESVGGGNDVGEALLCGFRRHRFIGEELREQVFFCFWVSGDRSWSVLDRMLPLARTSRPSSCSRWRRTDPRRHRTGSEPFFRLNATCVFGSTMTSASFSCA